MIRLLSGALGAAMLTGTAGVVLADGQYHSHGHVHAHTAAPLQITVSCARFSLDAVIWDKPQAVFIDDLVRAGYEYERAYAIGNRICRDEALVGNTAAMGATMTSILRTSPPNR
ncbi:MAG: hypothetical protein WBA67_14285 [Jannaschia sp.]